MDVTKFRSGELRSRLLLLSGIVSAYDPLIDGSDPATDDCSVCGDLIGSERWYWRKGAGGSARAHDRCDDSCPSCGYPWPILTRPCLSCGTTIEDVAESIAEASSV